MNFTKLAGSFEESVERVKEFALQRTVEAARQQQLYYHNQNHVEAVRQRAGRIFQAIAPHIEPVAEQYGVVSLTRTKNLIDICAIAHDMVQEFLPQEEPHTTRKRESGVSETQTIAELISYINSLNNYVLEKGLSTDLMFSKIDIKLIEEAIEATICLYDTTDNSIYQPLLYSSDKKPSLVSYALALADIGALGMQGVEAFHEEGSLIFLEENPDVIPEIQHFNHQSATNSYWPDLSQQERFENIRQRLLRRARFQVNFAKGRKNRFHREVEGLPDTAVDILENEVFKYLTEATIRTIEEVTPTGDSTTLQQLLDFFKLDQYISEECLT